MKLSDLSPDTIAKIRRLRYDRIIEKHEGPEPWESVLKYYDPEFLPVGGRYVLLPVLRDQHPNITILRATVSEDERTLTVFLKDTTHAKYYGNRPEDEMFFDGFCAVCERWPDQDFYIALLYHGWFIVPPLAEQLSRG